MAAPVTKWSVQIERADEIAPILRRAFKVATDAPKGPVFVALPIDVLEQETSVEAMLPDRLWRAAHPDPKGVEAIASLIAKSSSPTIVVGDDVARAQATDALVAFAETIGASVWFEGLRAHASFPTGHPNYRRSLPGDAAQIRKAFGQADLVLLVGGPFFEDIWFASGGHFPECCGGGADRGIARADRLQPSARCRSGRRHGGVCCRAHQPAPFAGKRGIQIRRAAPQRRAWPISRRRRRTPTRRGWKKPGRGRRRPCRAWPRKSGAGFPTMSSIVDESITASLDLAQAFHYRGFGDYFGGRGGGIGQGLSGAIGVKVAMPDRPVVAISGDGSAMYSIQALWTAAHHKLAIVFVILANREYRILKHNVDVWRQNFEAGTQHPYQQMDLTAPGARLRAPRRRHGCRSYPGRQGRRYRTGAERGRRRQPAVSGGDCDRGEKVKRFVMPAMTKNRWPRKHDGLRQGSCRRPR